jgi:hypothetical protein
MRFSSYAVPMSLLLAWALNSSSVPEFTSILNRV